MSAFPALFSALSVGLIANANATVSALGVADQTAVNLMMAAVSTMAAAIVFLFFWFRAEFALCHKERQECHERHVALLERVAKLER